MKFDPHDTEVDVCLSFNEAVALKALIDYLLPLIRQHGVRGQGGTHAAFAAEVTDGVVASIQQKIDTATAWMNDSQLTLEFLVQLSAKSTPAGKLAREFINQNHLKSLN